MGRTTVRRSNVATPTLWLYSSVDGGWRGEATHRSTNSRGGNFPTYNYEENFYIELFLALAVLSAHVVPGPSGHITGGYITHKKRHFANAATAKNPDVHANVAFAALEVLSGTHNALKRLDT